MHCDAQNNKIGIRGNEKQNKKREQEKREIKIEGEINKETLCKEETPFRQLSCFQVM